MAYRSTNKTRQKKDAKRTKMMQAAIRIFADKGYHDATIRDIVRASDVAIGTFYFYFPDKETLFIHLYEETADFLLQAIRQAVSSRLTFSQQIRSGIQSYVNIAVFEPAIVQLLLVGGAGAVASLVESRANFRQRLIDLWQRPLDEAIESGQMPQQNSRRLAEAFAGAIDEVVLNLLNHPDPEAEAVQVIEDMTQFCLRATAYAGS